MQIANALLISTIAGLSTVIGGLIVFLKIKNIDKIITFCLSFTATIMIGISVLELFPESFFTLLNKYTFLTTILSVILIFVIGIIIIRVINHLLKNTNNLYKIGILNMIALILHNFPEGITTFITSMHDIDIGIKIGIAIMFHNIPEGIAIAAPIYCATNNKLKAISKTFISGLSEPLGAIFAYLFLKNYIDEYLISFLLIIVSAIMISLSLEKLLPEAMSHNSKKMLKMGLILGLMALFISLFVL